MQISSKTLSLIFSIIISTCIMFMLSTQNIAHASVSSATSITKGQIVERNDLLIMGLNEMQKAGFSVKPVEIVEASPSDYTTRRIGPGFDLTLPGFTVEEMRSNVRDVLREIYPTAVEIDWPNFTSSQQGYLKLKYPTVGTYKGIEVGAMLSLEFGNFPNPNWVSKFPIIQVSDLLSAGLWTQNSTERGNNNLDSLGCAKVQIEYFYSDTEESVDFTSPIRTTINSLNHSDERSEFIAVPNNEVLSSVEIPSQDGNTGGNVELLFSGDKLLLYGASQDDWVDHLPDPTFYKNSASFLQNSNPVNFEINAEWWAPSSATLGIQEPLDPIKTADKDEVEIGDIVHYSVSQEVMTKGSDNIQNYTSFDYIDVLPKEVTYIENSAKIFRLYNEEKVDITNESGAFSFDAAESKLSFSFSTDYLNKMLLNGEIYQIEFDAEVIDLAPSIVNNVSVIIEDHEGTASVTISGKDQGDIQDPNIILEDPEIPPADIQDTPLENPDPPLIGNDVPSDVAASNDYNGKGYSLPKTGEEIFREIALPCITAILLLIVATILLIKSRKNKASRNKMLTRI